MFVLSLSGLCFTIWEDETRRVMEKVIWVTSDLVCWGPMSPAPRDIPDFKPEFRQLGLESQLWAWKGKKSQLCWLESRYWEPRMWNLETRNGSEADRRPGTPGADQNPITSRISLLITALTALRMKYWKWQVPTRHPHLFLTAILETFSCMQHYTKCLLNRVLA